MTRIFLIIILSALVTQVPRTIPYFLSFTEKFPKRVRKCMMLLPVAALGALIFPSALTDFGGEWYAGLVGVVAAFVSSRFRLPMIVSILLALAVTTLLLVV